MGDDPFYLVFIPLCDPGGDLDRGKIERRHLMWDQASWTDEEKQNARLAAMPDLYTEPTWKPQRRSRTPKFSEWYHLPSGKRPPEVEGRKKVYDISQISEMWKREFVDGLGCNVRQLQAKINGHRVIVSQYENGDYVVASGNNARKADEGTLDDVIEGFVE